MENVVIITLKDDFSRQAIPELPGSVSHPAYDSLRLVLSALEQNGWGGLIGRNGLHGRLKALQTKPEGQIAVLEVTDADAFENSVKGTLTPFIYNRIDLPRPMARQIPALGC
jgi:hypothetical protein